MGRDTLSTTSPLGWQDAAAVVAPVAVGAPDAGKSLRPAPRSRGSAGWLAPGTLPPDRASDPGEAAASGWLT